jgi:hypothetical protein
MHREVHFPVADNQFFIAHPSNLRLRLYCS